MTTINKIIAQLKESVPNSVIYVYWMTELGFSKIVDNINNIIIPESIGARKVYKISGDSNRILIIADEE